MNAKDLIQAKTRKQIEAAASAMDHVQMTVAQFLET
jgi:hypothetical protein